MELNHLDIEQTEQYFQGKLSGKVLSNFEQRLATDEAFATEVEAYRFTFQGLKALEMEAFEQKIAAWGEVSRPQEKTGKRVVLKKMYRRLALAASLLVVAGFSLWWWAGSHYSNAALSSKFYQTPILEVVRSGDGASAELATALQAYVDENFEIAIQKFNAVPPASEHFTDAQFYLGHCYFLSKKPREAVAAFDQVLAVKDTATSAIDFENAEWTRLLAQLAAGETGDDFQKNLQAILGNPGHRFYKNAVALERDLGSVWRFFHS